METNNTDIFPSFAVEWELQLLSSDDRCLVNKSMQLLDTLPHAGWYRPEFFQSSIEVHSSICHNLSQLSDNLKKRLEELRSSSKTLGIDLSGGGTHPFDQQLIEFTPLHRYMEMEKKACYIGKLLSTFSFHIHVNVKSLEDSIYLLNGITPYLPLLLALSANSPFYHGKRTGFQSFRTRLLSMDRSYGLPPRFKSVKQFRNFYLLAQKTHTFENYKDIHWYLRPRPEISTLECRIMDSPTSIREAVKLTAFFLGIYLIIKKDVAIEIEGIDTWPLNLPSWINKENIFRASHYGPDAEMIVSENGKMVKMKDFIKKLLPYIEEQFSDLSEEELMDIFEGAANQSPADKQQDIFHNHHSFEELSNYMVSHLMLNNIPF